MTTFIALLDYTDQGIRNLRESPQRADAFNEYAAKAGVGIVGQYWTIGSHDGVLILDAPSDEIAASVLMHLASAGNVRTTTLRAYERDEAQKLVSSS